MAWKNGSPLQEGKFKESIKKTGLWKRYHQNGLLYDMGSYEQDEKTGEWKIFDVNGKLTKVKVY